MTEEELRARMLELAASVSPDKSPSVLMVLAERFASYVRSGVIPFDKP